MPEGAIPLPFDTADAEDMSFTYDRTADLVLEFTDWHARRIRLRFRDAAAVRWQGWFGPSVSADIREDQSYEITGSEWAEEYLRSGESWPGAKIRHFKFCFNINGILDVLAHDDIVVEGITQSPSESGI